MKVSYGKFNLPLSADAEGPHDAPDIYEISHLKRLAIGE